MDDDRKAYCFGPAGWARRVTIPVASFGSCSFIEPVDDLRRFGLLP